LKRSTDFLHVTVTNREGREGLVTKDLLEPDCCR